MNRILIAAVLLFGVMIAPAASAQEPGDLVLGQWTAGNWYPARVAEVKGTGKGKTILVAFYDGDVATLKSKKVKAYNWKKGTKLQCNWRRKGKYFPGKIAKMKKEWLLIHYDDGDKEELGIGRCRTK